jgi:hypothetical protein
MCIGLHQIDMGGTRPKIVAVALRGNNSELAKVTVEFHSYVNKTYVKNKSVFSTQVPVHLAPNLNPVDAFNA